mmetsp:Transcript_3468/g.12813  ORF Transcript_3468/g.12813 Transcript_3468/m.12813 type:complete len:216 (+) Transcript_3468:450-1097(+)
MDALSSLAPYPVQTTASWSVSSDPTLSCAKLTYAPPPKEELKISPANGSMITPTCIFPWYATPIETALSGMEWQKFVVPSMGSTTQSQSLDWFNTVSSAAVDALAPPGTLSSPRKSCVGKVLRTRCSITLCTSESTSVSKSRAFALVFTTSAPSLSSMIVAPSFAASVATFKMIWRIAGRSVSSGGTSALNPMGSGLLPSAGVVVKPTHLRQHRR